MLQQFYSTFSRIIPLCIGGIFFISQQLYSQECWPVFEGENDTITIACGEELPPFMPCQASSDCCPGLTIETFTSQTGSPVNTCGLSTANGPGPDWAFWLPDIYPSSVSWTFSENGTFQEYADGTAHLTGTLVNADHPGDGFIVDIWFTNGQDWNQWSALGRSYKDDFLLAANLHQSWTYYELKAGFATLTGIGNLAGSQLQLTHQPVNYYFGFQAGTAANNKNSNDGLSGWFFYSGWFNGDEVAGNGDINVDRSCVPNDDGCGSTAYTRICRATNDCNYVSYSAQVIEVIDSTSPVINSLISPITIACSDINNSYIQASDACSEITITYIDEIINPGCNGSVLRHYTVTDGCGNYIQADQIIDFIGGPPQFVDFPDDIVIECDAVENINPEVLYTNGCSNTQLTVEQNVIPGECANSYTIVYTYTLTDDCDNLVSQVWTITVQDETAPVLFNVPANQLINCGDPIPDALVYAVDNCTDSPDVSLNAQTIPSACGYLFVRTWTSIDECGNTAEATQTITVIDQHAPVFTFVPETITYSCGSTIEIPDATASDACSDVTVTFIDTPINEGCIGSFIRIYTATDGCGNAATASLTVNITDNIAPQFLSFPEDVNVDCSEIPGNETAEITYSDNCGNVFLEYEEETIQGSCPNAYSVLRTWTISDECGNSYSRTWTIVVNDNIAPVLYGVPADATMICGASPEDAIVFAIDNCSSNVIVSLSGTTIPGQCGYTFIRTWTVTDDCGNFTSVSQNINYIDNVSPVFTFVPEDVVLGCGDNFNFPLATASDNCSEVTVVYFDASTNDCSGSFNRIFTATDECGNSAVATQHVTIVDSGPPVIVSFPENITVGCGNIPSPEDVEIAFSDDCAELSVTVSQDILPGECPGDYQILYSYIVEDICGNRIDPVWTIYVTDDQAPVFLEDPADISLECGSELPETPTPFAIDDCSSFDMTFSESTSDLECGALITRTWIATDACGNTSQVHQYITLEDTTAPYFTEFPDDILTSCDAIPGNETADVLFNDDCGNVSVDFEESVVYGACPNSYSVLRTWTLTDDCGNSVSRTWTIIVTDTEAPVLIGIPEDATINCGDPIADALVFAVDNCSDALEVGVNAQTIPLPCGYQFVRTWFSTDECGNTSEASQVITVLDNQAPVFTFIPESINYSCGLLFDIPEAIAEDACSGVTVNFTDTPLEESCLGSFTRTFTATDGCGNTTSVAMTINVIDDIAPEFLTFPDDVIADCSEVPGNETAGVAFSDNCGNVSVQFNEQTIPGECPNAYTILRTWTISDDCENTASRTWTIHVEDHSAPVLFGVPSNTTMNCGDTPSDAIVFALDNCSSGLIVSLSGQTIPSECGYTFIRTWSTTDDCGNVGSQSQIIEVYDNVDPVFTEVPQDLTVQCGADYEIPLPAAVDDCSDVNISFTDIPSNDCAGSFTRLYTSSDACGNTATISQHVTITDFIAPIIVNFPQNVTVNCNNIPTPDDVAAEFFDACTETSVEITQSIVPGNCPGSYQILYTYHVQDNCGNSIQPVWVINVEDNENPTFLEIPENLVLECGDEIPEADILPASDDCSAVEVFLTEFQEDLDCGMIITRIWRAIDACGNYSLISQTITLEDNTPPHFTAFPEDVQAECNAIPGNETVTVSFADNCGNVSAQYIESTVAGDCPNSYSVLRTWALTDDCGNNFSRTWTITVTDNTPPALFGVPQNTTLNCGDPIPDALVFAIDNCSGPTEVGVNAETIPMSCGYLFVRSWFSTDDCGNTTTSSQTITVLDNQAPVFNFVPGTITVSCGQTPEIPDATAVDACSDVTVSYTDTPIAQGCLGSFIRVYTATDGCGNTATASVTVNFIDNTPPQFLSFPEDVTVDCSEIPGNETAEITYSDNCGNVSVQYSETNIPGTCPNSYAILRTWIISDDCGNSASRTWTIVSQDNVPPALIGVPGNTTMNCGETPQDAIVFALDNCSPNVVVSVSAFTVPSDCGYTFNRTWSAQDDCGNITSATQVIQFIDEVDPEFTFIPDDVVFICGENINTPLATAQDNCSGVTVTYEDVSADDCSGSFTRIFTATDACGNAAVAEQNITVFDFNPPVIISFPQDVTTDCLNIPTPANVQMQFSDNCSEITTTISELIIPGNCPGNYEIRYVVHVEDHCGNSIDPVWTITVVDNQPPVFTTIPPSITAECGTEIPETAPGASDQCSEVTITFEDIEQESDCGQLLMRVWTATDDCGNAATINQSITLNDTTSPFFVTFPEDLTISCSDEIPPVEMPVAFDDCAGPVEVFVTDIAQPGSCPGETIIQRIFRAFDLCGNQVLDDQMIYMIDNEAPVFDESTAFISTSCTNYAGILTTAVDNCSSFSIDYADQIIDGSCGGTVVRTYQATDLCGNQSTFVQTIELTDQEAPVFTSFPQDISVECSNIPQAETSSVAYSDNCSTVDLTVTEEIVNQECANSYTLLRTYTITDQCGNNVSQVWNISVSDNTAPVLFGVPSDVTIDCGDVIEDAIIFAQDNCSGATPVSLSANTENTDCGYIFTRTWTSVDDCGNISQATQVITAEDMTPPVLEGVPADEILECGQELPTAPFVNATDNCAGEVNVDFQEIISGEDCGTVQRTWCATDCAGQTTCQTQTITFVVPMSPELMITYQNSDEIGIKLSVDNSSVSLLDIYSISGQKVQNLHYGQYMEREVYTYNVSTKSLSVGVYVVRLSTGGKTLTVRFVVSR